ncbi:MAG TPA: hypothetical protein VFA09_18600 [Ktedonobacteraceae bacterium]|jgi:hypothetical protein|nr:hypothetical protein [Ktedonobacteraceae bacterium]
MNTINTSKSWLEKVHIVLGVLLISVPFVFGITAFGTLSLSAWILAAIVGVVAMALAILWLGFKSNGLVTGATIMLGTVVAITPWVMGDAPSPAGALIASVLGALLIVAAGSVSAKNWNRQATLATSWRAQRGLMESE